jgi:hypothetical protein
MSQLDSDSIDHNTYDYNLDYMFDGLTNYHGYASETGFQQGVNQSAPELDSQDVLKQMQARPRHSSHYSLLALISSVFQASRSITMLSASLL